MDHKKINLLFELGNSLENLDSSILFAEQGVKLAQLLGDKKGEAQCKGLVAILNWSQGDFPSSIKLGYSALEYFLEKQRIHPAQPEHMLPLLIATGTSWALPKPCVF